MSYKSRSRPCKSLLSIAKIVCVSQSKITMKIFGNIKTNCYFANTIQTSEKYIISLITYPIKLHYSQTSGVHRKFSTKFYYLMKLHYSQTVQAVHTDTLEFYYLMKLHYSQTYLAVSKSSTEFYYLMKLHYSQTAYGFNGSTFGFTTL